MNMFSEMIIDSYYNSVWTLRKKYGLRTYNFLKLVLHRDNYVVISDDKRKLRRLIETIKQLKKELKEKLEKANSYEEETSIYAKYLYDLFAYIEDSEDYEIFHETSNNIYFVSSDVILVNSNKFKCYALCFLFDEVII